MSLWVSLKVSILGNIKDIMPFDGAQHASSATLSFGGKYAPPINISAISRQYPNLIFACTLWSERPCCKVGYDEDQFLVKNGEHKVIKKFSGSAIDAAIEMEEDRQEYFGEINYNSVDELERKIIEKNVCPPHSEWVRTLYYEKAKEYFED
jgi:hypothetical protein